MNNAIKRAQTLAGDALEQAAQSGVARAMASRQAAGVELTGTDIDRVSGGLVGLTDFTRAGGRPVDFGLVNNPAINPATNPVLPDVQVGALQNAGMVV
jgi:hypothetical protein